MPNFWRQFKAFLAGRIRYKITRGGVLFTFAILVVAFSAILSSNNLLFLIVAAMMSTLLISGLISRLCLAGLELNFKLPEHIPAGRSVPAQIFVSNHKWFMPSFSIHVEAIRDPMSPTLRSGVYFPLITSGATLAAVVDVTFPRRGTYRQNSFAFSTGFPFGFLERTARVTLRREMVVYPCIDPQPGFDDLLAGIAGEIETHYRGLGRDFYRIRPYEAMESSRHVDWKASAHTGNLQIREFAREQEQTVEIFLDRNVAREFDEWFEHAVTCCAFLAWRLSTMGAAIHFRSNGYECRQPEDGDIYTILKYLALVYPQNGETPESPLDDSSFKIVFTASAEAFRQAGWVDARLLGPDLLPSLLISQTPDPQKADPTKPDPVKTSVTVVEHIEAGTPANVTTLDSIGLQESPGTNLDDRLRDIPGFSLFKRSSSVVANPTTQGVSLRGIGSSGASRTLVLWDGIPASDPFGAWVYWTQFVPNEIDRVEITRGAATSIFGDRAMSGALGVFSRQPEKMHVQAEYEFGNENTHDVSAGFANAWSRFAISGAARGFTTDGYYIVPDSIRGPVDHKANVRFATGDIHLDEFSGFGNFFFKINILAEERENGTTLGHNSTGEGTVSLRYVREFAHDWISLLGFHTQEGFHSTFTSVGAGRKTETLSYTQSVPSDAVGGAFLWQHHELKWNLFGGADVNRVEGWDTDHLVPTGVRVAGGTQLQHGVYAQGDATLGWLKLFGGLRHSFTGQNGKTFLSPSGGFVAGKKSLRARGSVYRSFRAPTLNELYRTFKAGNTTTEANPALVPETLWGAEAGFDWIGENSTFRVTGFRNEMNNLITNVTLSSSATAIVRQRANAAAALSRGMEADFRQRYGKFTGELQYLLVDSRYVTGYRVSQIPKHQGTAQVTWQRPGTLATVGLHSYAYQFDDDLNQFKLPGYATLQLVLRQHLARSFSAEATLENALNHQFYTAFTPTPNIGAPRLWRIGLRWDGKL